MSTNAKIEEIRVAKGPSRATQLFGNETHAQQWTTILRSTISESYCKERTRTLHSPLSNLPAPGRSPPNDMGRAFTCWVTPIPTGRPMTCFYSAVLITADVSRQNERPRADVSKPEKKIIIIIIIIIIKFQNLKIEKKKGKKKKSRKLAETSERIKKKTKSHFIFACILFYFYFVYNIQKKKKRRTICGIYILMSWDRVNSSSHWVEILS